MEINLDFRGTIRCAEPQGVPSRSLSYSGCWTCRERRTKCDERPGACRRCEDAKLVCGGYDIRLNWTEETSRRRSRPGGTRRHIKPGKNLCKAMTDSEVTEALASIDKVTKEPWKTSGPFSVFRAQPKHTDNQTLAISQSPWASAAQEPFTATGSHKYSSFDETVSDLEDHSSTCNDKSLQKSSSWARESNVQSDDNSSATSTEKSIYETEYQPLPIIEIEEAKQTLDTEALYKAFESASGHEITARRDIAKHTSTGLFHSTNAVQEIRPSMSLPYNERALHIPKFMGNGFPLNTIYNSLSPPLIKNRLTSLLIHHYTNNIVHLMQPVSHRGNPFQTLYLPLAIEGSTATEVGHSSQGVSPATIAVFHSLLCSAATNLQGLGSGESGLQQLACRHKERALNALRTSLSRKVGRYKDLMVAILSLVSVDILDGGVNDHWIHLDAAIKLQESRHHASLVSKETSQLNMICTMLRLFAQTALPYPEPIPWSENSNPDWMGNDFSDSSIEYIYGITTSLARLIKRIYRITQHLAFYQINEYPMGLLSACEELGDHLSSWTIDSEPFSAIGMEREDARKIARAQAKAFHSAALIYYYRSVQNCSREDLYGEQGNTLSAMNEAEDLKLCLIKGASIPAPLAWPAFIASCEAIGEYRQHWDNWWRRVEKYRLRSFHKQHSIVQEVWENLDRCNTSIDWREALAAMNFRIIPV